MPISRTKDWPSAQMGPKVSMASGANRLSRISAAYFKGLALSCRLGCCAGRGGSGGKVGVCDDVSDCDIPGD